MAKLARALARDVHRMSAIPIPCFKTLMLNRRAGFVGAFFQELIRLVGKVAEEKNTLETETEPESGGKKDPETEAKEAGGNAKTKAEVIRANGDGSVIAGSAEDAQVLAAERTLTEAGWTIVWTGQ